MRQQYGVMPMSMHLSKIKSSAVPRRTNVPFTTLHPPPPRNPWNHVPANTGHPHNAVSMLGQRRRRWAYIETASCEWPVFAGIRRARRNCARSVCDKTSYYTSKRDETKPDGARSSLRPALIAATARRVVYE